MVISDFEVEDAWQRNLTKSVEEA